MAHLRKILSGAALMLLLAGPALAAPPSDGKDAFGVPMGGPVRKLEGARSFKPGWYNLPAPPKPDARFAKVAVDGQPQKLDSCQGGACVADLWGEDLQTGDRRYGYRWEMHDAGDHAVREVSVVAVAHSVSSYVFLAQFDSGDLTRCRANELTLDGP